MSHKVIPGSALAAAGLPTPAAMQERSALPILRGEPPADWRKSMYYRYYHYPQDHRVQPHLGVRTERHKLIWFDRIDRWELFDLAADPHELKNLHDDPSQAATLRDLKAELGRLKAELGDTDQFRDAVPTTHVDGPPVKS